MMITLIKREIAFTVSGQWQVATAIANCTRDRSYVWKKLKTPRTST
jgi:hypothetical protein